MTFRGKGGLQHRVMEGFKERMRSFKKEDFFHCGQLKKGHILEGHSVQEPPFEGPFSHLCLL